MPPAVPDKIPCESVQNLEQELVAFRNVLSLEETEETWDRVARALARFGAVVKGGGYNFETELVSGVKYSVKAIVSAMNSDRTRLSAAALECIGIIAPRIGLAFEPLVPLLVPHILRIATRPSKVYVTRSQGTLGLILGYCHVPTIILHLVIACKESRIASGRAVALEGVLRCLNKWDWAQPDLKSKVGDIEEVIRITGRDKDANIRQTSRKVFETYKLLFPERVDEFTGPLTPVMKKYLNIKSQHHGPNLVERVRHQSAAGNSKRPPARQDLAASTSAVPSSVTSEAPISCETHVRSASSNDVLASSRKSRSDFPDNVPDTWAMPPPPTIPIRGCDSSRVQTQSHEDQQQEKTPRYERQRVASTASSTHSAISVPPDARSSNHELCPPGPAAFLDYSARPNLVAVGSSGQARRVLKVASVEPHPANRSDLAHQGPMRVVQPSDAVGPRAVKATVGPSRQPLGPTRTAPLSATGVGFPMTEPGGPAPTERKGAQRIPKPIPRPPAPTAAASPKAQRPATAIHVNTKREVKPSIFLRRALSKHGVGAKEEKKQEPFIPRRGGGVTQPTISQLSKQKVPASVNNSIPQSSKLGSHAAANRPAWGTRANSRTVAMRGLPAARGRQGGVARPRTPKIAEKHKLTPAMVPLPASPGREMEVAPQLVPLPASPKTETPHSEQTNEVPGTDIETVNQVLDAVDKIDEAGVVGPAKTSAIYGVGSLYGAEKQETVPHSSEIVPDEPYIQPTDTAQDDNGAGETPSAPSTPPFPSTDGASDEDDLRDIEFISGDAYTPGGSSLKASEPPVVFCTGSPSERSPLGKVILN